MNKRWVLQNRIDKVDDEVYRLEKRLQEKKNALQKLEAELMEFENGDEVKRENEIVSLRDNEAKTFVDLGKMFGISTSYARNIYTRAKRERRD